MVVDVKWFGSAMKWENLDRRSTMTHMVVFPFDGGKWVMKSIVMSDHVFAGTGSGWMRPYGLCVGYFVVWQVEHLRMKSVTSCLSFDHEKEVAMK